VRYPYGCLNTDKRQKHVAPEYFLKKTYFVQQREGLISSNILKKMLTNLKFNQARDLIHTPFKKAKMLTNA
jgi:hypothetical protein